jgi:hypothetical protein
MPSRPSHLPHNLERNRLAEDERKKGSAIVQAAYGGQKYDCRGVKYLITPAGEAALKAKIPLSKH